MHRPGSVYQSLGGIVDRMETGDAMGRPAPEIFSLYAADGTAPAWSDVEELWPGAVISGGKDVVLIARMANSTL